MTAREAAFLSLQKYRGSGKYSNIELSGSIERLGLEGAEKALYTALFTALSKGKSRSIISSRASRSAEWTI